MFEQRTQHIFSLTLPGTSGKDACPPCCLHLLVEEIQGLNGGLKNDLKQMQSFGECMHRGGHTRGVDGEIDG